MPHIGLLHAGSGTGSGALSGGPRYTPARIGPPTALFGGASWANWEHDFGVPRPSGVLSWVVEGSPAAGAGVLRQAWPRKRGFGAPAPAPWERRSPWASGLSFSC